MTGISQYKPMIHPMPARSESSQRNRHVGKRKRLDWINEKKAPVQRHIAEHKPGPKRSLAQLREQASRMHKYTRAYRLIMSKIAVKQRMCCGTIKR